MSLKKRVVIVVGIPDFDYQNEQSAVAAFLRTIKTAFEKANYTVQLGLKTEAPSDKSHAVQGSNSLVNLAKKTLKKWKWAYQSLAFKSFFKRQDLLINLANNQTPADLVVEFHTVGSTLGVQLSKKWNCQLSVIFDSPVDQQFLEMYGTKTMHWNRIQASEKLTMESAAQIMAYSPECAKYLQNKYKITAKTSILPCVINKSGVNNDPTENTFNIGFIGSFLSWHKVDFLVRAFHLFLVENPQSKLQLIGFGEEWQSIKNLVKELGLEKHVEMPGFVSEEELIDYKSNFSIAIMPGSNWYGSPLKLFEYAQSGIPFIAPTSKTVVSIFEAGKHCLFVNEKDEIKSIQEALKYSIENPIEMREMGRRSQEFVNENFEEVIYGDKLVEILMIKP